MRIEASKRPIGELERHWRRRVYDRVELVSVPEELLEPTRRALIAYYQPVENLPKPRITLADLELPPTQAPPPPTLILTLCL